MISTQPRYTCVNCGRVEVVVPDGRGFPPDIAKRKLERKCKADGCSPAPVYRAGLAWSDLPVVD